MEKFDKLKRALCLPLFFSLFMLTISAPVQTLAQEINFCGNYIRPNPPSLDENREQVYVDRFGNYYLLSELLLENAGATSVTCNSGIFNLSFSSGFTSEEEETICEVFGYLESVLGVSTTNYPITIFVQNVPLPGPTAGTGSPNWDASCGIANSTILEKLLGGGQDIPFGFLDGIIRIDADITDDVWHTLSEDGGTGPDLDEGELDLYSVVLHEALHILGFASRIGADGMPRDIYNANGDLLFEMDAYSRWDKHIYSTLNNQYIVESDPNGIDCCNHQLFNSDDFFNMPDPIDGDCLNGIVFNGSSVSPNVNNLADLSQVDPLELDGEVANKLSHIYEDCNNPLNEDYVMHPSISLGPDGVNRVISSTELEIFCDLEYNVNNSCENECVVIAQNDYIIRYAPSANVIFIADILENDILPSDFDLEFDFLIDLECGNLPPGSYTYNGGGATTISPSSPPPSGLYFFCYTLFSCDGEVCNEGIVYLNHGLGQCDNECNLFCAGNFEDFNPRVGGTYYKQLDLDPLVFNGSPTSNNTPDIHFGEPENQFVHFARPYGVIADFESLYFPLSNPLAPGCSAEVSFRATSDLENSTIQFYASNDAPCPNPNLPTCDPLGFESCSDYFLHCMTIPPNSDIDQPEGIEIGYTTFPLPPQTSLIFGSPNNIVPYPFDINIGSITYFTEEHDWNSYSFNWTNQTNEPINFITIIGSSTSPPAEGSIHYYIDDIEIISSCENQVSVIPSFPDPVCIGNTNTIEYLVCHTGSGTASADVILSIDNLPTGIVFGTGGDFVDGEFLIESLVPNGSCETVTLEVLVSNNFQPGTTVSIPIEVELLNACWMDFEESTVELNLDYCCDIPLDASFTFDQCGTIVDFTSLTTDNSLIHSWDFETDGNTDSNMPNPTFDFLTEGTYSVTHVVTNNCGTPESYTETIIVIIEEPADPSFNFDIELCTFNVTFTSNDQNGEHSWDFGDGNSSTDINTNNTYINPGIYNVVHQITSDCGVSEETITITIEDCLDDNCECLDGLVVTAPNSSTNISTESPNQQFIYNSCVSIEGTLIIDVTFSFVNCNIYMHPGAEIIVLPGRTLNIVDSQIESCGEQLWQSITVQNGARLTLKDSDVFDGREAVRALNGAQMRIVNNVFDRNYVGIFVPENLNGNTIFSAVMNNEFTCTEDLLPNYEAEDLGTTSYAGVWMNDAVGLNIGSPFWAGNVNTFSLLRNGVIGINSIVNVHHVDMDDLEGESPFWEWPNISGIGIYTNNSRLQFSNSDINNAYGGVFAERSNLDQLDNCWIENVQSGVRVQLGFLTTNNITNNDIYAQDFGIWLSNMDYVYLNVSDNDIYPGTGGVEYGRAGIISFNSFYLPGESFIEDNEIFMTNTYLGCSMSNVQFLSVKNNDITELSPFPWLTDYNCGIGVFGSMDCQLRDNDIIGLGATSPLTGIQVANSTSTAFCCNTIDNTKRGVGFVGVSDDTNLRGTDLSNINTRGLDLAANASIGAQFVFDNSTSSFIFYGNRWLDGMAAGSAQHNGTTVNDVLESRFRFDPNEPWNDPINPISVTSQWFVGDPSPNNETINCDADMDCQILGLFKPIIIDDNDVKAAQGSTGISTFAATSNWESSRYLYRKLLNNPVLSAQHVSVDSFFLANENTNVGLLTNIDNDIHEMLQPDEAQWSAINLKREELNHLNIELYLIDSLLWETPDSLSQPIVSIKDSLLQLLGTAYVDEKSLAEVILMNRGTDAQVLEDVNSAIAVNAIFDINRKAIHGIYLQTIAMNHTDFDQSQLTTIENIAGQCPMKGGNAVYAARGLLSMVKDTIFDDEALCSGTRERAQQDDISQNNPDQNQVRLFPNPAKETINFSFREELEEDALVSFYDITGQIAERFTIPSGSLGISRNVNMLNSGVYFCKIEFGQKQIIKKLAIFK